MVAKFVKKQKHVNNPMALILALNSKPPKLIQFKNFMQDPDIPKTCPTPPITGTNEKPEVKDGRAI